MEGEKINNSKAIEHHASETQSGRWMSEEYEPGLVSVVIPVYNAEKFLTQAVKSALDQPETGEVILIEDESPDNCLSICQELANQFSRVKLLQHPDGKNHGAGASRNLGIINAKFEYIAFLDADDFYLPDRFKVSMQILNSKPEIDGVYETVDQHIEGENVLNRFIAKYGYSRVMGIEDVVQPEKLFEAILTEGKGWIHPNATNVRRSLFNKTGLFDEHLRSLQDNAMCLKMAALGRLVAGRTNGAVAKRRIYEENRSLNVPNEKELHARLMLWKTMHRWGIKTGLSSDRQNILLMIIIRCEIEQDQNIHKLARYLLFFFRLLIAGFSNPSMFRVRYYWKNVFFTAQIKSLIKILLRRN